MTSSTFADQLAALRGVVFGAIASWNAAHPHPLRSHQEHGSVNVSAVYTDETGVPSYTITVACLLSGVAQLTFHGHDPAAVAEHARLTLEHRICAEVQSRTDKAQEDASERKYDIAS